MSEPTMVLVAERGNSRIVVSLYGVVSLARAETERRIAEHRAEQLSQ